MTSTSTSNEERLLVRRQVIGYGDSYVAKSLSRVTRAGIISISIISINAPISSPCPYLSNQSIYPSRLRCTTPAFNSIYPLRGRLLDEELLTRMPQSLHAPIYQSSCQSNQSIPSRRSTTPSTTPKSMHKFSISYF